MIYQGIALNGMIVKGFLTEKDGKTYIFSIEVKQNTVTKIK